MAQETPAALFTAPWKQLEAMGQEFLMLGIQAQSQAPLLGITNGELAAMLTMLVDTKSAQAFRAMFALVPVDFALAESEVRDLPGRRFAGADESWFKYFMDLYRRTNAARNAFYGQLIASQTVQELPKVQRQQIEKQAQWNRLLDDIISQAQQQTVESSTATKGNALIPLFLIAVALWVTR